MSAFQTPGYDAMTGARFHYNPRAVNYLRATGHTWETFEAWRFVQWHNVRLREARSDIKHAFYMTHLIDHTAYNFWLDKRVDDLLSGVRPEPPKARPMLQTRPGDRHPRCRCEVLAK